MRVQGPAGSALLAPGFPFRPVNNGQDGERDHNPEESHRQYQGNPKLSAHDYILRLHLVGQQAYSHPRLVGVPAYITPSSRTAARTSCTVTASSAGSGWSAKVSPRLNSARVRTMCGPGGGPQISGGAGPNNTTDGVP
jgi:hypothetical protein